MLLDLSLSSLLALNLEMSNLFPRWVHRIITYEFNHIQ